MNEGKDGNGVCDGENQMDDKDALQAAAEELICLLYTSDAADEL